MTRPPAMPDEDYEAIEAAVMDTARGRWFLAEFARRNRTADTALLLAAIERLEGMLAAQERHAAPTPHEPAVEGEPSTSAESELFAIEHGPRASLPLPSVPDDVAWLEGQATEEPKFAPPDVFEIDDEELTVSPPQPAPRSVQPQPAVREPEPPVRRPEPVPRPSATAQSSMLAAALAQVETTAHAAEPAVIQAPPMTTSPPAADPAELDALSFEEKSVYFS